MGILYRGECAKCHRTCSFLLAQEGICDQCRMRLRQENPYWDDEEESDGQRNSVIGDDE